MQSGFFSWYFIIGYANRPDRTCCHFSSIFLFTSIEKYCEAPSRSRLSLATWLRLSSIHTSPKMDLFVPLHFVCGPKEIWTPDLIAASSENKRNLFVLQIKLWTWGDSNPWSHRCQRCALPAKLQAHYVLWCALPTDPCRLRRASLEAGAKRENTFGVSYGAPNGMYYHQATNILSQNT